MPSELMQQYGDRLWPRDGDRLRPLNALGEQTSGPLILGRDETDVKLRLRPFFQQATHEDVRKRYIALVQFALDRSGPLVEGHLKGTLRCRMRRGEPRSAICESEHLPVQALTSADGAPTSESG